MIKRWCDFTTAEEQNCALESLAFELGVTVDELDPNDVCFNTEWDAETYAVLAY